MKGIVYCVLSLLAFLFWVVLPDPPDPRQGFSNPPASASQMLALKACASTAQQRVAFFLAKCFQGLCYRMYYIYPGQGKNSIGLHRIFYQFR